MVKAMRRSWPNGTRALIGRDWCATILPTGHVVRARPNAESPHMAFELGYADDVAALTREHDVLHSELASVAGLPFSLGLAQAAGLPVSSKLASLEESAVLAVQKFTQALKETHHGTT